MQANHRKYLVVIIILAITGLLILRIETVKAHMRSGVVLTSLPLNIGQWQGRDLNLSQETYQILETEDVVLREYTDLTGDRLYLYIVFATMLIPFLSASFTTVSKSSIRVLFALKTSTATPAFFMVSIVFLPIMGMS